MIFFLQLIQTVPKVVASGGTTKPTYQVVRLVTPVQQKQLIGKQGMHKFNNAFLSSVQHRSNSANLTSPCNLMHTGMPSPMSNKW